ncbi:MAG: adenylate/guanylate cyclase domain-containing protein [Bacteroidota bacterium]
MRTRLYVRRLLINLLAWILALTLFAAVRNYGVETGVIYEMTIDDINLLEVILVEGLSLGFLFGLGFSVINWVLDRKLFRRLPYGLLVLFRALTHIMITLIILAMAISLTYYASFHTIDHQIWGVLADNMFTPTSYMLLIYSAFISIIFNLIRQMNLMFGPGILYKVMTGKYHNPKEEGRIFMFLDLRSSTTYAERLGHMLYSQLIQDCFYDLTEAVRKHNAEIYQYVGDEAVLTWPLETGLKAANCLHAFFTFNDTIQKRADYYFNKYDLVPAFKAGVNMGLVTVAEVGVVKKEIAYHSDVLNTAARIQGRCNEFGKQILISQKLKKEITDWNGLSFEEVGTVSLKGKLRKITIFCVGKEAVGERKYEFAE